MHQTDELASGKHESALVLILGDFIELAPIEGFVLQVEQAELVGSYDEVVATIRIADFGHTGVLRDKACTGALGPGDAKVLSQVLVFREARDIDDLG